jgi:hypothetical protein
MPHLAGHTDQSPWPNAAHALRRLRRAGPPHGVVMPRSRASHSRPLRGNVGPRRGTPPLRPRRTSATAPGRSNGTVSDSPRVDAIGPKTAPDSPRVMPETACKSSSWKWWPGTESNHRHADFQSAALPTELPGHGRQSRPGGRASEGRELDPRGLRSSRLPDQSNLNKSTQLAASRGSIRGPQPLRRRRWPPDCLTLSKESAIRVWRHGQSQDDK